MKKLIFVTLIPVLLLSCKNETIVVERPTKNKSIKVSLIEVQTQKTNSNLSYSGVIEAYKSIPLTFQSSGIVEKVYVEEGDFVKKGQVLAETDDYSTNSALNSANASYQQALDARKRLKKVYDAGSLPEIKWVEINSKAEQAKSTVEILKKQLSNCKMTAPTDAYVGSRNIEAGMSSIQLQSPIMLVKTYKVYAKISVPENEIILIEKGIKADIELSTLSNKVFHGIVDKVGLVSNKISRTYSVKILINNDDLVIKPGMVCEAKIHLARSENEILVPLSAILNDSKSKPFVFKLNPDNQTVSKQYVDFKGVYNNSMRIISGLSPGDKIVGDGNYKLSPGSQIRFKGIITK